MDTERLDTDGRDADRPDTEPPGTARRGSRRDDAEAADTGRRGSRRDDASPTPLVIRIDRRRGLMGLVVAVLVIAGLLVGLRALGWWPLPKPSNPFSTQTTDRSQPVVLRSVQDLSRYVAATGNFDVVVDLEKDAKFLPSSVYGTRTLFVAAGTVEAYVDFGGLATDAVTISEDRKSVTVKVPAPALSKPNIDHDRSYIYAEQRGLVDRMRDAFGGDPNRVQQLNTLAETKIAAAAKETELPGRAQANTKTMLESLLRSLGFTTVTVTFAAP